MFDGESNGDFDDEARLMYGFVEYLLDWDPGKSMPHTDNTTI